MVEGFELRREINGVSQYLKTNDDSETDLMIESDTGRTVFRCRHFKKTGRIDYEVMDYHFFDITIDGEKITQEAWNKLKQSPVGPNGFDVSLKDRTIKIKS